MFFKEITVISLQDIVLKAITFLPNSLNLLNKINQKPFMVHIKLTISTNFFKELPKSSRKQSQRN